MWYLKTFYHTAVNGNSLVKINLGHVQERSQEEREKKDRAQHPSADKENI